MSATASANTIDTPKTTMGSRAHQILAVTLLVWIIISGPFALIDMISALTNWRSMFFAPGDSWTTQIAALSRDIPLFSSIPAWAYGLLYLFALVGTTIWYYWRTVDRESHRLYEAAIAGKLDSVSPKSEGRDGLEIAVAGGAIATNIVAGGMIKMATATGAALGGPPGLVLGLFIGSVITLFALASRSGRLKEEAEEHAREQTKKLEASRKALAEKTASQFKRRGARNLLIALAIATVVVAANYGLPTLLRFAYDIL